MEPTPFLIKTETLLGQRLLRSENACCGRIPQWGQRGRWGLMGGVLFPGMGPPRSIQLSWSWAPFPLSCRSHLLFPSRPYMEQLEALIRSLADARVCP